MSTSIPEYPYTLPSSGKTITWRPLGVGVSIQIVSQYPQASQAGMRGAALLGARIRSFDGQPRPAGLSYGEIQAWEDEFDLEAFGDEVHEKETMRRMVLKKKGAGGAQGAKEAFRAALEETQLSLNRVQDAISAMLLAADAMKAEYDPLGSQPSST